VSVFKNGVNISDDSSVEEQTGVLVLDQVPADGDEILVSGTYYRYFTATEVEKIVQEALLTHSNGHTDVVGRQITIENLPVIEEYPVVIHAVTLALYTLATDASFDIDIQAPDGVNIPRSERYRQLMDMIQARQSQYRELCTLLGIGLYRIDVFNLNRISKATGRLVPMYLPQEVDDRSYPERTHVATPTLGAIPQPWETEAGELTAYQGRSFITSLDVTDNFAGKSFTVKLLNQRNSPLAVREFVLSVNAPGIDTITGASRTSGSTTITITTSAAHGLSTGNSVVITNVDSTVNGIYTVLNGSPLNSTFTVTGTATTALALTGLAGQVETNVSKDYTFTFSLTKEETRRIAERTYWSLSTVDDFTGDITEVKGGKFFTIRGTTIVI
jgi:hypothetical protein